METTGVHRAEPALHVGHDFVLGLPDDEGQDQEADDDRGDPHEEIQPERHQLSPS